MDEAKVRPRLTITDAAKLVKMSRQNLHKTYIKNGILSVSKDEQGRPYIDFSDLIRVFPSLRSSGAVETVDVEEVDKVSLVDSRILQENKDLRDQIHAMSLQLEAERARAERAEDGERWARSVADKTLEAVKLLEHKNAGNEGWLSRFFNKGRNR